MVNLAKDCPYTWRNDGSMFTIQLKKSANAYIAKKWVQKLIDLCIAIAEDK